MLDDKIIIAKDGVKRELTLPLDICLSRKMARHLLECLRQADHDDFQCGWITIFPDPPSQTRPETPTFSWKEGADK